MYANRNRKGNGVKDRGHNIQSRWQPLFTHQGGMRRQTKNPACNETADQSRWFMRRYVVAKGSEKEYRTERYHGNIETHYICRKGKGIIPSYLVELLRKSTFGPWVVPTRRSPRGRESLPLLLRRRRDSSSDPRRRLWIRMDAKIRITIASFVVQGHWFSGL